MSISPSSIHHIHSREDFLHFLSSELAWPIPDDLSFDDVTFDVYTDELGIRRDDLRGSVIAQLRPFVQEQPWGIFILQLQQPRLYVTELRKVLRALEPMKRKLKDFKTWNPQHVLFICTNDWKNYTFAHFEGENAQKAKIATFGWEYQSNFIRTLCEFNIEQLKYPQESDMFGLDPQRWIEQWSSAFDVKKVTKKFYEEYDGIFKSIKRILAKQFGLSDKLYDKKYVDWTEKEIKKEEPLHLFVQNLVNRLMFLKFLEKRRWLDFNPNYLADLHKRALAEKKNFYSEYLFYVFFAGLNRQVEFLLMKEEKTKASAQMFQERIGVLPFLNGGLFEKEPLDEKTEIPNEAFKELFDLFSRYNFTINEDTPLNVEVAVNPEMLGKVFEESVIARKEKGAYYTPRNIVSFMCREALKNHLKSQKEFVIPAKAGIQNVDASVRWHDTGELNEWNVKIDHLVDSHDASTLNAADALGLYKALYSIKVLDPAVGSGAFPVGMMFEILECYKAIGAKLERDHPYLVQNRLANPKDVYRLKKQIIQNNLYGVDIEDFAVNIARLRFWLSLAVDFPIQMETREEFIAKVNEIEPLPNLLYKIRQGDSLLAKYHGVSLETHGRIETGEVALQRKQRIKSVVGDVTRLKQLFFAESDSSKKKTMQREIESQLKNLVAREVDFEIALLRESSSQHGLFEMTKKEKEEAKRTAQEITRLEEVKKELLASETLPMHFPVIWDVDFGEVLDTGGFDVVIANPPYVRQEEFKEIKEDLALHYDCYTGTADLFTYFYERGVKLLKPGGTISYISSNKYFRAGYGAKLREYLANKTSIKKIIDFGELPVFSAGIDPSIIIAVKESSRGFIKVAVIKRVEEIENIEGTIVESGFDISQENLTNDGWTLDKDDCLNLLQKIQHTGITLSEYVNEHFYYGIKTGYNKAFIIDGMTRNQFIKEQPTNSKIIVPWLDGHEILRWNSVFGDKYLIALASSANHNWPWSKSGNSKQAESIFAKTYPLIFKHLLNYKTKLKNRKDQGQFWWELRSCSYWSEFESEKIVFNETSKELHAFVDYDGIYVNKTGSIIVCKDNEFVIGVLNSKLLDWYYRQKFPTWGDPWNGGRIQFRQDRMLEVPIVKGTDKQRRAIEERVEKILKIKKAKVGSTLELEKEIDAIVYEMYGLTEEERRVVEDSTRRVEGK